MDSRLTRVAGTRLVPLLRSDAPRVAQAIVGAVYGSAKVYFGEVHGAPFIRFIKERSYDVVIRGDDWRKIFPFLHYSTASYSPVIPPATEPSPVPSIQPNRVVPAFPVIPDKGLKSFLEFPFDEYSKIQKLLTILSVNDTDKTTSKSFNPYPEPPSLNPPVRRRDKLSFGETDLYNRFVFILQQLFPNDFPVAPEAFASPYIFVYAGDDMIEAGEYRVVL